MYGLRRIGMNAFYNKEGIGDVLLLATEKLSIEERKIEQYGGIVKVQNKHNKTVGINLLNASNYGEIDGAGAIEINESIRQLVKKAFEANEQVLDLQLDQSQSFVIGLVESKEKHPNADKLSVCQVRVGKEEMVQIVCGAPNVDAGQKVVVALESAVMPSGLVIKQTQLRGVESKGMICSAKELDLEGASNEKGILVLTSDEEIGSIFSPSIK